MNPKEIKDLIEFVVDKGIAEFELERGDLKLRLKRNVEPQFVASPAATYVDVPQPVTPPGTAAVAGDAENGAEAQPEEGENLFVVRSPIVGTFYESPSPGAPAFVKIGDVVKEGQPLCIVEAMKLMNEIESDASGEVVKIYVNNAQPVEYGQPLFGIKK